MGWKEFEVECTNYLNNVYGSSSIKFIGTGFSDSSSSDVEVVVNGIKIFNVEIKDKIAQSGQFVLLPLKEKREFDYSKLNKYPLNDDSKAMIKYMNTYFEKFSSAGTRGENLDLSKDLFYKWIIDYYKSKGVKFVITENKSRKIIFPIDKLRMFFRVSAKYRVKKSGSANPSRANENEIKIALNNQNARITYKCKKVYVESNDNINGKKMPGVEYVYLFKRVIGNTYNVKRLSNTANSNVIFSISLNENANQSDSDLELFKNSLR